MYSPKITTNKVKAAEKALGKGLVYHSAQQIAHANFLLGKKYDAEQGKIIEPLKPSEKWWVDNERTLCMLDFRYWLTHYAKIINLQKKLVAFTPNIAQNIVLDIWAEMEEEAIAIYIQQLKARQLGVCLHPETLVLTSKLRWIPIVDLTVGELVVSVDEFSSGGRGVGRKMRPAVVVAKREVYEPAFKLTLDNGECLVATGLHRFLTKTNGQFTASWRRVKDLSAGKCIRYVSNTWGVSDYEDGWFGGILDGEGSLRVRKHEGGIEVCMSQVQNEVLDRARQYLVNRGYTFHVDADLRKSQDSTKLGNKPVYKLVLNRMNEVFRLIGQTRPSRFVDFPWWEGRELPGKRSGQAWSEIISIEPLVTQRMIDIQTSTGTFIANGFVSHNSTLTELAVAHRAQFYINVNALVASSDERKSETMSKMMEVAWSNQPWFMLPEMTSYRTGELIEFGKQNSAVSIQHGKQTTGLARGTTPNIAHLCLSPHTLVRLQNGTIRPISEVSPNDRTITSRGRLARIVSSFRSQRSNELTSEVWLWGNFAPLSCTRDHPVMSEYGWIEASKLLSGDYVRFPIRPISRERESFTVTVLPNARTHNKTPSRTYPLDFDWGWLCGLYLAEGSVLRTERNGRGWATGVCFSISADEQNDFTKKLSKAVGGNQYIGVRRSNSKTRTLCIQDSMLARWIYENFGRTDTKRIPDWAWTAGRDFCRGLLCGYLEGDGHIPDEKNDIPATSICVQIPVQLRELIASLGYGWSAIYFKPGGYRYGRNCLNCWSLYIQGPTAQAIRKDMGWANLDSDEAKHWRFAANTPFIEVEILRVLDGFSEEFYDLEVDAPEHDFCTLQCVVHNSELADYDAPEDLVDASLLHAMHEMEDTFLVLESTAAGIHDWWHQTWDSSKEGWPSRRSTFRPIFLPWFIGRDIYPTVTWLKKHPIDSNWKPSELVLRHAERCREYVASSDFLKKYLGEDWKLPPEQMWWYELSYEERKKKGELGKFLQEVPADDIESFQSTNISAFDAETIEVYHANTKNPEAVFGFVGPSIPLRMQPDRREIDWNKPPIPIHRVLTSGAKFDCQLMPLKFRGYPEFDFTNRLFIWEFPQKGQEYGIGIDTSDGVGQDRSVMEGLRKGRVGENDFQCCEFASAYVNAYDLSPLAFAVGELFSVEKDGERRQPKMVIECNRNGELTQLELRKMGYINFHQWIRYDSKKMQSSRSHKFGWYTNQWSRPMIMDCLVKRLRDNWLDILSPYFVTEMRDLERDEYRQSLRAMFGGHDDRIMAMAMVLFSLHVLELDWAERGGKFTPEIEEDASIYSLYNPNEYSAALEEPEEEYVSET